MSLLAKSVFRRMKGASQSDIFAAWLHRIAVILYFIYSLWAVLVMWGGVPSLVNQQGDTWTSIFAVFVFITATPACVGAAFFPRLARLELFSGAAFVALMGFYYYFVLRNIYDGEGSVAGFEILLSIVVMPVIRTFLVIALLLQQAEERRLGLRGEHE